MCFIIIIIISSSSSIMICRINNSNNNDDNNNDNRAPDALPFTSYTIHIIVYCSIVLCVYMSYIYIYTHVIAEYEL